MIQYRIVSQDCPNCRKHIHIYSESYIHAGSRYSYDCPHCGKTSSFKGSIGIEVDKLPKSAVPAKVM